MPAVLLAIAACAGPEQDSAMTMACLHGPVASAASPDAAFAETFLRVFPIASLSKQFTAAGILLLESEGRLDVHDTLGGHLAGLPPTLARVTLHQLLSHSAGLLPDWPADESRGPFVRADQAVAAIATLEHPGRVGEYAYSNLGYILLGAVIEQVSGLSYDRFIADRLAARAGLRHTFVVAAVSPATVQPQWDGYAAPLVTPQLGPWSLWGAGGVVSTPAELDRWYLALRRGDVLPPSQVERLWQPQVWMQPAASTAKSEAYGYGWRLIYQRGELAVIHHGGIGFGYKAVYRHYPASGIRMAIVTNLDIQDVGVHDDVLNNLLDILGGERFPLPPPASFEPPPREPWVFVDGADTVAVRAHAQAGWAVVPAGPRVQREAWGIAPGPRTENAMTAAAALLGTPRPCTPGRTWVGPQFVAAEFKQAWCALTTGGRVRPRWIAAGARPLSWSSTRTVVHFRWLTPNPQGVKWLSLLLDGDALVEGWTSPDDRDPRTTRVVPVGPGRLVTLDWFRFRTDSLAYDPAPDPAWIEPAGHRYRRVDGAGASGR